MSKNGPSMVVSLNFFKYSFGIHVYLFIIDIDLHIAQRQNEIVQKILQWKKWKMESGNV